MLASLGSMLAIVAIARASPLLPRAVDSLNEEATAEAQQRDDSATRAFSDVQIKTSDGRCLFVDKLSGDFRANLTPIQVADCGSTDGQGWDVITSGKHISGDGGMLVVSTLTQACFNYDPRRAAGNQVILFSCGGRADGGGEVTDSQIFAFNGSSGPLSFQPQNEDGTCFTVSGNTMNVAPCDSGDSNQSFTFGDGGGSGNNNGGGNTNTGGDTSTGGNTDAQESTTTRGRGGSTTSQQPTTFTTQVTTTADATATASVTSSPDSGSGSGSGGSSGNGGIPTFNPTEAVPVSRAGGTLQPTAVAESHQRDDTATRAFSDVSIRGPDGRCLFIDPTAGDFRENLIPIQLVECTGSPNEKWDVLTSGKHNQQDNSGTQAALIVSTLTQGCLNFDGRRATGDTVMLFSCGGRAAGEGETSTGQQFPFNGATSFALAPLSEKGSTCLIAGNERVDSGACPDDGSQLFSIF
ncbi:hypothetical protein B0H65DRAFT_246918 [Neurospora tetraspora]|uniref:Ricin B lectin domain-containing protein n=1 Tax=Neurospora tetraspora TaxID=94610 RepID=A0AAE0MPC8_9PEZI|nr:hypothetical protein B0H65DRAFT_246918 [Neurospora tetraspora]